MKVPNSMTCGWHCEVIKTKVFQCETSKFSSEQYMDSRLKGRHNLGKLKVNEVEATQVRGERAKVCLSTLMTKIDWSFQYKTYT